MATSKTCAHWLVGTLIALMFLHAKGMLTWFSFVLPVVCCVAYLVAVMSGR